MIKYTNDLKNLPPAAFQVKKKSDLAFEYKEYYNELAAAKKKLEMGMEEAAESHYQGALGLMQAGGIENNKAAAKEFKKAMGYVADYRDCHQKYEEARRAGTTRVAIIPFENKSGRTQYGAVGEFITDQVISKLFDDTQAMEFLEIIDREQLELVLREQKLGAAGILDDNTLVELGKVLGVQEILTGKITQIISDPAKVTRENQQSKRTVPVKVGEKKNAEGKTISIMQDKEVAAYVTLARKTASARMSGSYKILDVQTARLLETESFSESYSFNHEWGTFRGDERALSDQQKRIVQVREENPLSDGERINSVASKLADSLAGRLKEYTQ
jgi:TolB-like protein